MLSLLLIGYYLLITLGIGLAGITQLKKIPLLAALPVGTHVMLTIALFPTLVAWAGFAGLFRYIPFLAEGLGLAAAISAIRFLWRKHQTIPSQVRGWLQTPTQKIFTAVVLLFLLTFLVTHHCYINGGSNNFPLDEIRGLSFTSALAANYLKPAHQINLSLPIRYGYNFFEYTAFLYSAVRGFHWPSLPLFTAALGGILLFYTCFIRFVRLFGPATPLRDLLALLLVSFWGMDAIVAPESAYAWGLLEFWNNDNQITQTSSMWNLLYHYMAAIALGMEGVVYLDRALNEKRRDYLIASTILLCTSITFAALAGMFMISIALLALLLHLLVYPRRDASKWLLTRITDSLPYALLFAIFILLPNAFIWIGSQGYIRFHATPALWFNHVNVLKASQQDWYYFFTMLWYELGTLHMLALLLAPFMCFKLRRSSPFAAAITASMIVLTIVTLSMFSADTPDFFWRTGGVGVLLLASVTAVQLCDYIRPRERRLQILYWAVLLALLVPGIYNFYTEQYIRYLNCHNARGSLAVVNRLVDLHSPINSMPYSSKEVYFSGRIAAHPHHDAWWYLHVHGLPSAYIKKWFNADDYALPCGSSWYGRGSPNGYYADVIRTKEGLKVSYTKCPEE